MLGTDWTSTYKRQESYTIGQPLNTGSIKTIKVAVHIWQDSNGGNNFPQNTQTVDFIQEAIDNLRFGMLAANDQPSDIIPGVTFNPSIGLDVEYMGITFHQNSALNSLPLSSGSLYTLSDQAINEDPEMEKYFLLHFVCPTCYYMDNGVPQTGIGGVSNGTVLGSFGSNHYIVSKATALPIDYNAWVLAQHWAHELGHSMKLCHTYGAQCGETCITSDPDYLSDVFNGGPCWQQGGWNCDVWDPGNTCTNNMMGSTQHSGYYSPLQIGRMHRSLSTYGVRKYAWGYDPIPYAIVQDEIWDFNIKFYRDIVVETGHTLTIRCTVEMVPEAKIIVQPGGKLVVDGGTITAAQFSEQFWGGIQVWGDNTHNQQPNNLPTYQGMVVLKNGATIEHAREAIILGREGVWNTFGGVVQATDAHFINCRRSVAFASYQNTNNNGAPIGNRSFFTRCEFTVDDTYRGGNDFYAHVSMWDVSGINFKACDFSNEQSTPLTIQSSEHLGKGIIALDANFTVSGVCDVLSACNPGDPIPECPVGQLRPSRFIGLDHGVNAMHFGTGRTFTVTTTEFTNNICGIYSSEVDNFAVLRCNFISGNREVDLATNPLEEYWEGAHRGIYNYGGNGFRIEENTFGKDASSTVQVEGVVNGYTGAFNDQVYKNVASGIDQGYVGEGVCLDIANDPEGVGLCFLCNENVNNVGRDLVARLPQNGVAGQGNSFRKYQGSANQGAGNSFTPNQNGPYTFFNIENEPEEQLVKYYENSSVLAAGAYNDPWVNEATSSTTHPCPTRIICGGGAQVRSFFAPQVQQANLAYLSLKYVHESLIDGGDFEELKESIMLTWPSEAWDLRNELMGHSPYLSVDILFEAANRNILPDAMMLEICVANPDATQQEDFVKWIEEAAPNPLPPYMVAQIMASWDQETWRTSLESGMAEQLAEMGRLNAAIIGALRMDTIPEPLDSVLVRWQMDPALGARYGEAQTLLEMKQFAAATELMEGLENTYNLRERDLEEKQDMLGLIALLANMDANEVSPMQLDPERRMALATIGEGGPTHAGITAQNLLCFGYGECASPVTGGSMQPRSSSAGPAAPGVAPSALTAYPNPASSFVTIEHHVSAGNKDGRLIFRDLTGREIERHKLNASPGQSLWDTRTLAPGMYTIELYNGKQLLGTQRVIIRP